MSDSKRLSGDEVAAIVEALPSFEPAPGGLPGEGWADEREMLAAGFVIDELDTGCLEYPGAE